MESDAISKQKVRQDTYQKSSPELSLLESLVIKACHHAKIVTASLERFVEIRVLRFVGVDDFS